jgi:hypothetical protein
VVARRAGISSAQCLGTVPFFGVGPTPGVGHEGFFGGETMSIARRRQRAGAKLEGKRERSLIPT